MNQFAARSFTGGQFYWGVSNSFLGREISHPGRDRFDAGVALHVVHIAEEA
jgi:hypothetical protein